jgi:DNA invertase Pin-like site-specific DNA recombinase
MKNLVFGYCRVSTKEQNEGRQLEEMRAAGVDERNIYIDKASGKDFERSEYKALVARLREGDLVIVKSIDRLGRDYSEILEQWRHITQEVKAHIRVLDIPLLDTTANTQTLDSRFIADLMLQILCYVSEKERRHIKQRQAEGIALAKAQGRRLGRPTVERPDNWGEIYAQWFAKDITAVAAMKSLGLKSNTFYKFVKEESHRRREMN